jgi:endonuclease G
MVVGGVFPTTSEQSVIICHTRFVIGYSVGRKAPLWVAEVLTSDNVVSKNRVPRVDAFRPDPVIKPDQQASVKAFIGTEFDKGHMVPFEDVNDNPVSASESFFMTNMVAQNSANNRGIWRALENYVRNLTLSRGKVYIITGPIFSNNPRKLFDGTNIPSYLYKVILVPQTGEAYTFILPNTRIETTTLPNYISTISHLQEINPAVNLLPIKITFMNVSKMK